MQYPLQKAVKAIQTLLAQNIPFATQPIKLEKPPDPTLGDFAFPCFSLAAVLKKKPNHIASDIAQNLPENIWIERIEVHGSYINFFLNTKKLVTETLTLISKKNKKYGYLPKKNKTVIIEHTSANPNGPLHVGRARNPIIGDTLVRIFRAAGFTVDAQFYLDDMGKQVAILCWGVQHLSPDSIPPPLYNKPDHQYVGYYQKANEVMLENPQIKQEISTIIQKSERGDKKIIDLIHKAYRPVLNGMTESLNKINICIDTFIPESRFVLDHSVDFVIEELKKSKYCAEEQGAFFLDMKEFGVHGRSTKFFFLRKDGTTLYATRDVAYHLWKEQKADKLINILGEDHKLEAHQVATALKILHAKILPETVFYAFVSLPGGKMSTRHGRVVFLDDLIEESIARAHAEVQKRRGLELDEATMNRIAQIVGVGAIRYNIIKVQPEKDIEFRWEEALNFEGNSMPFIQYAHARACGILKKAYVKSSAFDASMLTHLSEISLIKCLARLPLVVEEASKGCKPHVVAGYAYEIAALFNQFYRDCPVINVENKLLQQSRIQVVNATKTVLVVTLDLLGVVAPEEM